MAKINDYDLKIDMAKYLNKYTSSIRIEKGVISLTLNNFITPRIFGEEIRFSPKFEEGAITWTCKATNIKNKYLPPYCRN